MALSMIVVVMHLNKFVDLKFLKRKKMGRPWGQNNIVRR
jgi:hypothetical protein